MRELYESQVVLQFLGSVGQRFLDEGSRTYVEIALSQRWLLD